MTYNSGTATDYLDMLDQLVEVTTSRNMATVAVNAGGTGHAIGDIIDITATGSTSTHLAKIEVTSVAAGVIDGVRVYRGGAYTVDPTTTTGNAQSATTGSGTGATFDITFAATGWTLLTEQEEVDTVDSVAAGGTGYTVGDDLTLVGGVLAEGGAAATFSVDTESAGVVTAVSLLTRGDYEVFPTDPVATTVAPAGGSGCTLNLTPRQITGDRVIVLQGDAGGSATDPLVGIKTYSDRTDETATGTVYNWALFGMTAWGNTLRLDQQSNVSPGFNTTAGDGTLTTSTSGDGSFLPLKDSTAFNIEWTISATGRRVHIVAKVETASTVYYAECSFGLFNQFGITTELPYPAYILAPSDRSRCWYQDTASIWGGFSTAISRANGPMFVWSPEGAWLECKNAIISTNQDTTPSYSSGSSSPRVVLMPLGDPAQHELTDDQRWTPASTDGFDTADFAAVTGAIQIYRTPDTGGNRFPLLPLAAIQADSTTDFFRAFGEIDGIFFVSQNDAAFSSEDRFEDGALMHTIFQNGTQISPYNYVALRED